MYIDKAHTALQYFLWDTTLSKKINLTPLNKKVWPPPIPSPFAPPPPSLFIRTSKIGKAFEALIGFLHLDSFNVLRIFCKNMAKLSYVVNFCQC